VPMRRLGKRGMPIIDRDAAEEIIASPVVPQSDRMIAGHNLATWLREIARREWMR
jgi:hypothetical protein